MAVRGPTGIIFTWDPLDWGENATDANCGITLYYDSEKIGDTLTRVSTTVTITDTYTESVHFTLSAAKFIGDGMYSTSQGFVTLVAPPPPIIIENFTAERLDGAVKFNWNPILWGVVNTTLSELYISYGNTTVGLNINDTTKTITGLPNMLDPSGVEFTLTATDNPTNRTTTALVYSSAQHPAIQIENLAAERLDGAVKLSWSPISWVDNTKSDLVITCTPQSGAIIPRIAYDASYAIITGLPNMLDPSGVEFTLTATDRAAEEYASVIRPPVSVKVNSSAQHPPIVIGTLTAERLDGAVKLSWPSISWVDNTKSDLVITCDYTGATIPEIAYDASYATITDLPNMIDPSGVEFTLTATDRAAEGYSVIRTPVSVKVRSSALQLPIIVTGKFDHITSNITFDFASVTYADEYQLYYEGANGPIDLTSSITNQIIVNQTINDIANRSYYIVANMNNGRLTAPQANKINILVNIQIDNSNYETPASKALLAEAMRVAVLLGTSLRMNIDGVEVDSKPMAIMDRTMLIDVPPTIPGGPCGSINPANIPAGSNLMCSIIPGPPPKLIINLGKSDGTGKLPLSMYKIPYTHFVTESPPVSLSLSPHTIVLNHISGYSDSGKQYDSHTILTRDPSKDKTIGIVQYYAYSGVITTNSVFEIVNAQFTVTYNTVNNTVILTQWIDESSPIANISSIVSNDGDDYSMVSFSRNAFKNNTNLERINLPDSVNLMVMKDFHFERI